MKKVSIIIPVHNVEKYLKKCLDSILNQTYKNIEIICVENGSTDSSPEILNEYKNQIKIISLKESGISIARNAGIKASTGEYIYFLDSDDYADKNLIKSLVENIEKNKTDLSFAKYYSEYEEENKIEKTNLFTFNVLNKHEIIENLHNLNFGPQKLYKSKIIKENKIEFPLNLKYEDVPFVMNYISHSNKISLVNEYLYYYVIHNNSETTTMDKRVFDIIKILKLCENYFKKEDLTSFITKTLTTYTIKQRYQKDKKTRNTFITEAFDYLNKNYPNWKKCKYWKTRKKTKSIIEKSKLLTKIYCNLYQTFKR